MSQTVATIQTCTGDLIKSKAFYQKLNFSILSEENSTLLTDGSFLLEINPDRFARIGLKLYQENWSQLVSKLKDTTAVVPTKDGFLLSDPNGVKVYLVEKKWKYTFDLSSYPKCIPGNFAGLSIEATDFERTVTFWKAQSLKALYSVSVRYLT